MSSPNTSLDGGFVQVAVDSSGKKVAMFQTTDGAGNAVYVQAAVLIGDTPDLLNQIKALLTDLLAVNRANLMIQQNVTNLKTDEDDFRPS